MGDTARAGFAIEIRERYGDVARGWWPVSVDPLPDELLSSWLHRLALANGIVPRSFAGVLVFDERMWSPRLDGDRPPAPSDGDATCMINHTGYVTSM